MINKSLSTILLTGLLGVTTTIPVIASGNYSARPPKPPGQTGGEKQVDHEKYSFGNKIYEGSAKLMGGGKADEQMVQLKMAQALLPADAAKMHNLVSLAGKLSATELAALEYFVKQRFAMKK